MYEKACPTKPFAVKTLVICGAGGSIVSDKDAVPGPEPLEAISKTENVPETVGVPVISPVPMFTVRPDGSPVAL